VIDGAPGSTSARGGGAVRIAQHLDHNVELVILVDERLQFLQPFDDLPTDIVHKRHACPL
jgi:hypothetical protein